MIVSYTKAMETKIKAIIVDDEPDARNGLEKLLLNSAIPVEVVAKAENAQNALELIIDSPPNIVFVDIQMPVNNGFWLAEKIGKLQLPVSIVFVTAYDEYALEAIRYAAFDFFTKPIETDVLEKTLKKFTKGTNSDHLPSKLEQLQYFFDRQNLKIDTLEGSLTLKINSIIYCKAHKQYTKVFLTNGTSHTAIPRLEEVDKLLPASDFVQINQQVIINKRFIEDFNPETNRLVLTDILQKFEFKVSAEGARLLAEN